MNRFHNVVELILFVLNVLMLFGWLFVDRMEFPPALQSIGRVHPLLLHLPIGIVVVFVVFLLVRNRFEEQFFRQVMSGLLALGALTATATAIMGLILSREGGYDEDTLFAHRTSGVLFAVCVSMAYAAFRGQKILTDPLVDVKKIVFKVTIPVSFILLLLTGHFGSILTHGDEFVLAPLIAKKENKLIVSDSTSLYAAAIQPILHQKCTGCHNEKKRKGDLVLSTLMGVAKGGEHGLVWKAGSPQASLLMKRVLLPEVNEDHMPPQGKAQLTAAEVQLLFQWILSGADTAKAWTKYSPSDTVRKLADQFIRSSSASTAPHYTFDPVSPETVEKLNDPYRVVTPVALNEPALSATFFIKNEYKSSRLEELSSVREQLVWLNLSKMPVTDADCEIIRKFEHLEKLNLNFSSITEKGLQTLSSLPELISLSVAGTALDAKSLAILKNSKKLKEVFVWNTAVTQADVKDLPSGISWSLGFVPDENERLRLTPPIPAPDKTLLDKNESIALTHKFPGAVIRYTTDGSDPDSTTSKVYEGPFSIDGYTVVKARACKEGWLCSRIGIYVLYSKGVMPSATKLFTAANKDYRGEGAATLTNNKKGFTDDHRDIAWIGFRENPMNAEFVFGNDVSVKEITLSYDFNPGGWLFPPAKIEVWGGEDEAHLKLIKNLVPEQPKKMEATQNAAIVMPVESHKVYKIIASPLKELPKWHPSNNPKTKDKRAWLFVDEVIFSQ